MRRPTAEVRSSLASSATGRGTGAVQVPAPKQERRRLKTSSGSTFARYSSAVPRRFAVLALHRGPGDLERPALEHEREQREDLRDLALDGLARVELATHAQQHLVARRAHDGAALVERGERGRGGGANVERGVVEGGLEALRGAKRGAGLEHARDAAPDHRIDRRVQEGVDELAGDARRGAPQRPHDVRHDVVPGRSGSSAATSSGSGSGLARSTARTAAGSPERSWRSASIVEPIGRAAPSRRARRLLSRAAARSGAAACRARGGRCAPA